METCLFSCLYDADTRIERVAEHLPAVPYARNGDPETAGFRASPAVRDGTKGDTGMTTFQDRENAFEAKFAHDQDVQFRVFARRKPLLFSAFGPVEKLRKYPAMILQNVRCRWSHPIWQSAVMMMCSERFPAISKPDKSPSAMPRSEQKMDQLLSTERQTANCEGLVIPQVTARHFMRMPRFPETG